ncbi:hypothetical protein A3B51_00400 [Candidatus Curtissbacteria bacterium RIFCSPLOWO2_01_FULL_41_18]|uniref:Transglutaminase-like domain-containing protein n=1 Tax=Candidatus Curtissbacteria bacterium RIFCSPLOWO2_01_FULL_41_18 TaxID=1797727 RepID=A0A1F5HIY0_9BACT|nr:MAG: hypothetical protein A3B51_00400 [Candidatus Curtissbacteria bacterium RIFCSPLOWO2_01_FULL_41_18]
MRLLARTLRLSSVALCFFLFVLITHHPASPIGGSSLITREAYAEGEFETDYDVTYTVNANGKTTVTQNIILKNNTPNFYADKFELKIGSTKAQDVKASDPTGPLTTNVKFENNVTSIEVNFNQKVIGAGKTLPWQLSYTADELATKSGQIWEISVPRLAKSQDIVNYNAKVIVPRAFGPIAFAVPSAKSMFQTANGQEFTFTKDELISSGIAMSFGEKQVFSFKLNYYLENDNLTTRLFEIPLPPDNNYQKVVLENIDPKPMDVVVDRDGNFLAKYRLSSKAAISITAEGYVEVSSKPIRNIYQKLTAQERSLYTQPQRYWETDNAAIKEKAGQLKDPQKIYDFVSNYLTYSSERLNQPKIDRKGAAAAYANPKDAVCMEFTDLFIAIARSAGVPAREVEGYAFTQNERLRPLSLTLNQGDVLHAWPEYWDEQKGWVQIDPTWGSTSGGLDYFNKLDFNHITFVHRGSSSTGPLPAGAYKKPSAQGEKSVLVSFAQSLPNPVENPQISLSSPSKIISGFPTLIDANIQNAGSTSIFSQKVSLTASKLKSSDSNVIDVAVLPPFAYRTFKFNLQSANILLNAQDILILSYAGTQVAKPITIEPFYKIIFSPSFLLTIFISTFVIIFGLFLYKRFYHVKKF